MALNLLATVLLILQLQQAPPGVPGAQSVSRATIVGSVVRATSGEPIPRAQVTLIKVALSANIAGEAAGARGAAPSPQQQQRDQPMIIPAVTTDDQGKFQISDIEAGTYRIAAARNGFAKQEYGQRSLNRSGTVLNIRPGQPTPEIVFRLTPAGTVSGRVLNAEGEPLPGITVQALRSTYDATGSRSLQPVQTTRTNDLGEYRLYWINPGRYYVSANPARSGLEALSSTFSQVAPQAPTQQDAQALAQVSTLYGPGPPANEVTDPKLTLTYYPGTPDVSRALAMDVQPGAELRSVDFTLLRAERVRIRGRLIDAATGRPPQNATVSVAPRTASRGASSLDALIGDEIGSVLQGNRYNSATGEFEVREVASGSYWLTVTAIPTLPAGGRGAGPATAVDPVAMLSSINRTQVPVDVLGSDIDNLTVTLSAGAPIAGRIRLEGSQASNQNGLQGLSVSLQSSAGGTSILSLLGGRVTPAADGTFSIPRVTSGSYKLVVNGLRPEMFIKEARLNQTDVLQGLTVTGPVDGPLEVTLSANAGQVDGSLLDASLNPVSGVQAVLIPDRLRDRQDLFKTAVTGVDGRFSIRGIAPGDYRIFAWEDIEAFSYFDPDVLKPYEQQGKLLHIQESSKQQVELRIIPAP